MHSIVTSHQIYPALQALLGLPDLCVSFELRASVDGLVTVSCEHYLRSDTAGIAQLARVFSEYEMVPRAAVRVGTAHPAEAMGFDAWMRQRTEAAHQAFMKATGPKRSPQRGSAE